jgi:hypothetical protein
VPNTRFTRPDGAEEVNTNTTCALRLIYANLCRPRPRVERQRVPPRGDRIAAYRTPERPAEARVPRLPPRAPRGHFRSRSNLDQTTRRHDQVDGLTGRPRASNSALIRDPVVFTNCKLSRDGNLSVGRTDVAVSGPVVVDRLIGDITSLKKCRLHAN